jgi:hypothetical protein
VAQDDDLDRQIILSAAQEADELDHADEGQVEERESHGGILAARTALPKVLVSAAGDLLGTHSIKIAKKVIDSLPLQRHDFHGDWNYTVNPPEEEAN